MSEDHARRIQARKREDDAEKMWVINIILVTMAILIAFPFLFLAFDYVRRVITK